VDVKAWQDRVRQEGSSTGYVVNPWGRECPVEPERSYTQSPALLGQSCTSEVLYDGLIRLYRVNREMMDHILFPVHDEIIFEAPDGNTQWAKDLVGCVTCVVNGIEFTMEHGEGAKNWQESTH
jgi:DNA polymerase I-like protein with 3'-5' exonuclease and polymerase domains